MYTGTIFKWCCGAVFYTTPAKCYKFHSTLLQSQCYILYQILQKKTTFFRSKILKVNCFLHAYTAMSGAMSGSKISLKTLLLKQVLILLGFHAFWLDRHDDTVYGEVDKLIVGQYKQENWCKWVSHHNNMLNFIVCISCLVCFSSIVAWLSLWGILMKRNTPSQLSFNWQPEIHRFRSTTHQSRYCNMS